MRRRPSKSPWLAAGLFAAGLVPLLARARRRISLSGRTALITGGSRGLGLLLAEEFARRGAGVVICARGKEELERAEERLRALGAEVVAVQADLTQPTDVRVVAEAARDAFGRVDFLVNNAGVIEVGPEMDMTTDAYERAFALHVFAPLRLIQELLPEMRARRGGHIVNISSIGGVVSVPHLLPYCASKFGLTGLSEGLRAELAAYGITVTTVCPGLMRTGSTAHAYFHGRSRREHAWFALSAALPLFSMSARRAASRIVSAAVRGQAHLVLSWQAKVLALAHGLFPGATAGALGWVNRLLPAADPGAKERIPAHFAESKLAPSWLTRLNDRAAVRNNEVDPE